MTGHVAAVESALEHMLDAIQTVEADNLAASDVVPAAYLALDRAQEAYDFVTWSTATDKRYNAGGWADVATSHLAFRGSDMLKGVWDPWTRGLQPLVRAHRSSPPHGALSQRPDVLRVDLEGVASAMWDLKAQIRMLWRRAREADTVFWDRILGGRGPGDCVSRRAKALWGRWQVTP